MPRSMGHLQRSAELGSLQSQRHKSCPHQRGMVAELACRVLDEDQVARTDLPGNLSCFRAFGLLNKNAQRRSRIRLITAWL